MSSEVNTGVVGLQCGYILFPRISLCPSMTCSQSCCETTEVICHDWNRSYMKSHRGICSLMLTVLGLVQFSLVGMDHCSFVLLYFYTVDSMHFCSWMLIEFYTKKYFVLLLRTNILFFPPHLSRCLFCCQTCSKLACSEVYGILFKVNSCSTLSLSLSLWIIWKTAEEGRVKTSPGWERVPVAGCIRMYWRRNLLRNLPAVLILSFAVLWIVKMC